MLFRSWKKRVRVGGWRLTKARGIDIEPNDGISVNSRYANYCAVVYWRLRAVGGLTNSSLRMDFSGLPVRSGRLARCWRYRATELLCEAFGNARCYGVNGDEGAGESGRSLRARLLQGSLVAAVGGKNRRPGGAAARGGRGRSGDRARDPLGVAGSQAEPARSSSANSSLPVALVIVSRQRTLLDSGQTMRAALRV